jgi:hypothetical protein
VNSSVWRSGNKAYGAVAEVRGWFPHLDGQAWLNPEVSTHMHFDGPDIVVEVFAAVRSQPNQMPVAKLQTRLRFKDDGSVTNEVVR